MRKGQDGGTGGEMVEVAVIEDLIKGKQPVPKAKRYRIRVDKTNYEVASATITGKEILDLAGKTPEKWKLYQHKPGEQPQLVAPEKEVDLRKDGIERFTTMAKDTTEGQMTLQKDFKLPANDEEYLDSCDLPWETVNEGNQWLMIHAWKLPSGYNCSTVSIALLIPASYPDGEIDMVYVNPGLSRTDQKPIGALVTQPIRGESWQRWSRHRTSDHPWRRGIDDVASHLALVDDWFRREIDGAR